ncbi:MAG: SMC-Scp complex subunit ScpB [Nitrospiria bacterium]
MEDHELKPILEALLFVSSDPLSIDRMMGVIQGVEKQRIKTLLLQLEEEFMLSNRGFHLVELAGGYQFVTRSDLAPWIKEMERARASTRLSRPGLETLAIIAYKQPVTRGEVEMIRGVDAAGVLKTLLDRKLVKIVGRKEVAGRPMLYGTTRTFLKYLGLPNLAALPTLKEFSEIAETMADPEDTGNAANGSEDSEASFQDKDMGEQPSLR